MYTLNGRNGKIYMSSRHYLCTYKKKGGIGGNDLLE